MSRMSRRSADCLGTHRGRRRQRTARRLYTWDRPVVGTRLYAPLALLDADTRHGRRMAHVEHGGRDDDALLSRHPGYVIEEALHAVQRDRERAERALAERWWERRGAVDGGREHFGEQRGEAPLCGRRHQDASATLRDVGAARHHPGAAAGERTPVVRIVPNNRIPVHSWYLRLREGVAHEALWGSSAWKSPKGRSDGARR